MDYGKCTYEQSKLKKQKSKLDPHEGSEIPRGPGQHDYNIKMGRAEGFLDTGHKMRMVLQFRGRENAYKELGFVMMKRIIEDLKQMAHVDRSLASVAVPWA